MSNDNDDQSFESIVISNKEYFFFVEKSSWFIGTREYIHKADKIKAYISSNPVFAEVDKCLHIEEATAPTYIVSVSGNVDSLRKFMSKDKPDDELLKEFMNNLKDSISKGLKK